MIYQSMNAESAKAPKFSASGLRELLPNKFRLPRRESVTEDGS